MSNPSAVTTKLKSTIESGFKPRPLGRIEKGLMVLKNAGVPVPNAEDSSISVTGMVRDLTRYGEPEVVAVVRTLDQISRFNEVVRNQLDQSSAGDRYVKIAKDFTSIRQDSKRMVDQIEDGKLTLGDRLANSWMIATRGPINKRFENIRRNVITIHRVSESEIARMRAISEGYVEARAGLGEARILAVDIRDRAQADLEAKKAVLSEAQARLKEAQDAGQDVRATAELELARDAALQDVNETGRLAQIAEDLFNNLSIAYNTGDVVMGRIQQAQEVHERVFNQSVMFFKTNESVLTALSASFTQLRSLHETTQGHKVLKDGVNDALKDLATTGTAIMEAGLREGYGPTITADSVKALVDSIVSFQERSFAIKDEMRVLAAQNEQEIQKITEDGRNRLVELLANENTGRKDTLSALPGPKNAG